MWWELEDENEGGVLKEASDDAEAGDEALFAGDDPILLNSYQASDHASDQANHYLIALYVMRCNSCLVEMSVGDCVCECLPCACTQGASGRSCDKSHVMTIQAQSF